MSKRGTWVDAVAVQGMAKMLGRNLHIVTSQEQSMKQGYSVSKITANSNSGTRDPILFGHVGEQHFISLGYNDTSVGFFFITTYEYGQADE